MPIIDKIKINKKFSNGSLRNQSTALDNPVTIIMGNKNFGSLLNIPQELERASFTFMFHFFLDYLYLCPEHECNQKPEHNSPNHSTFGINSEASVSLFRLYVLMQ